MRSAGIRFAFPINGGRFCKRVATGKECARVLSACGAANYQQVLGKELHALGNSEMWLAGKATRALRPKLETKQLPSTTKGIGGRGEN